MRIDKFRIGIFLAGIIAGGLAAYFKDQLITDSEKFVSVLVTLFSVMAGFLVATITFLINDSPVELRSRISYRRYEKLFERRVRRNTWMFYCYLSVLLANLLAMLLENLLPSVSSFLERVYIGLGLAAMIWSFLLPSILAKIQREKSRIWTIVKHKNG